MNKEDMFETVNDEGFAPCHRWCRIAVFFSSKPNMKDTIKYRLPKQTNYGQEPPNNVEGRKWLYWIQATVPMEQ